MIDYITCTGKEGKNPPPTTGSSLGDGSPLSLLEQLQQEQGTGQGGDGDKSSKEGELSEEEQKKKDEEERLKKEQEAGAGAGAGDESGAKDADDKSADEEIMDASKIGREGHLMNQYIIKGY